MPPEQTDAPPQSPPRRIQHALGQLRYHLVWCPKYRRPVLTGEISDRLVELLPSVAAELGAQLHELNVRPDHVHLFGTFPPTLAPQQIGHRLKDVTSNRLRNGFPSLKRRLPSLWTRYCYVASPDVVTSDTTASSSRPSRASDFRVRTIHPDHCA